MSCAFVVTAVVCAICFAAGGIELNYKYYLPEISTGDGPYFPVVNPPDIDGYVYRPDLGGFSGAEFFRRDGRTFAVTDRIYAFSDGEFAPTALSSASTEIKDGLFVFERNGKVGLSDIFGNTVLAAEYDSIKYSGDTAIGFIGNAARVFFCGEEVWALRLGDDALSISAHDSDYVTLNGDFYRLGEGFDNKPLTAFGYKVMSPMNGAFLIADEFGRLGYADEKGVLSAPKFATADFFATRGFARDFEGNIYGVEYDNGVFRETKLELSGDLRFMPFEDGYAFFRYGGSDRFGLIDGDFKVLPHIPESALLYRKLFFGRYVLTEYEGKRCIATVADGEVRGVYDTIEPFEGGFLCDGEIILDAELREIYRGQPIYCGEFLVVAADGEKLFYTTKNNLKEKV